MTLVADRLQLLEVISAPGHDPVWRAWDARARRPVAAKPALPPTPPPPALDHPHLLPHEWLGPWVVTPLVRGGSAEQLLAAYGALPADYVAVLLDQLLAGLAALHDVGWVHGDVKPANLLLEPTGTRRPRLRLTDLGAARRLGAAGPALGTPGYVAPEARAGAGADPRHDLYAAGVTAVELLTGRVPTAPSELRRGRLRPLLGALVDPDPHARPPDARAARARLVTLGVPGGAPWQERRYPPAVPVRLGRAERRWWRGGQSR